MILSVALTLLLCVLATPQLAVASDCGIVVVQEDQLKQDIRREVDTALVSLLRVTGGQPPAETSDDQCEVELRDIKKDFNDALEQTVMNVTGVCEFGAEFDELKLRSDRLEEIMKDLNLGLREVNATVESAIETAVDTAVERAVNTTVEAAVERAVNTTVEAAVERAVNTAVLTAVERAVNTAVEAAVEKATKPIELLLKSLVNYVTLLKNLHVNGGDTPSNPASSCAEILAAIPSSPSGYYWVRAGNESVIRVYCDMTRTCGGITGGWMQVANIDMTNSSHTCPQGLDTITKASKRLCSRTVYRGCSSATFEVNGMQYTHVCGKIIGYQDEVPQAFYAYYLNQNLTIDDYYVDGVVLTHGANPRSHIWTFAAALDAYSQEHYHRQCPCINTGSNQTTRIPPWVGSDYFCDTAAEGRYQGIFYPDDPLWDGEGCGSNSTCCSLNNPPWFSKQLPSPTTDDIEMRLCGQGSYRHSPVEKILLFVQ